MSKLIQVFANAQTTYTSFQLNDLYMNKQYYECNIVLISCRSFQSDGTCYGTVV